MRDFQSSVTMLLDDRQTGFFFSAAYQMSVVKSKCLVVAAHLPHCLFKLGPADLTHPKGRHTRRKVDGSLGLIYATVVGKYI